MNLKNICFPADKIILNPRFFYIVLSNAFIFSALDLNKGIQSFLLEFFIAFCFNFSACFFIFFILSFLGKKVFNFVLIFLFFVHFILLLVNVFLIYNFSTTLTNTFFEIFLSTNKRETWEFIQFYFNFNNSVLILSCIFISILFYKIKFTFYCPSILTVILLFFSYFNFFFYTITSNANLKKNLNKIALYNVYRIIQIQSHTETSYIQIVKTFQTHLDKMLNEKQKENYIYYENNENKIPKIVLIIGESTQRNYMSLYNYSLNTTPNLKKLENKNELFVFKDVVAPNTDTFKTLRQVLTFANQQNKKLWHKEMNIIDAMKLLNYQTLWFSNQDADAADSFGNAIQALARRSDYLEYSSYLSALEAMQNKSPKDAVLIKMYQNYIQSPPPPRKKQNQFVVFHLMGAHYQFKMRYPESFQYFKPQDLIENNLNTTLFDNVKSFKRKLNQDELKMRTEYINAIYYNDYVVSNLMRFFENQNALVFYLSDHGIEVFDTHHLQPGHGSTMPSRAMVEVPFMIYAGKLFQEKHPHIMEKIKKNLNKPFMTDDFMHAFFDLFDIQCAECQKELSLFNEKYQIKDRLVGENFRNYDQVFVRQEFEKNKK